jgi:NADPH-dependent curcumin reductase CurA
MQSGQDSTRLIMLRGEKPGEPWENAFELMEAPRPVPQDGQILVRNILLDVAPYQRLVMEGRYPGEPGHGPGMPMLAESVGRVVESRHRNFAVGDVVVGRSLWQDYVLFDGERLNYGDAHRHKIEKITPGEAPLSAYLGVLRINGYTAFAGLMYLGEPMAGDTIVVSAAGGSVGSMVGQIAKIAGCRTVGIVSTPEKARQVKDVYGFDACVAYKQDGWADALMDECPDGIDIFYDNVGGEMLQQVAPRLNLGGKIVVSGFAADYGTGATSGGPGSRLISPRRLTIRGLVVWDHMHHRAKMHSRLARWLAEGRINNVEEIEHGLEKAPALLDRVMHGRTFGKALIQLDA